MPEIKVHNAPAFLRLTRFTPEMWYKLDERIIPGVCKKVTVVRLALVKNLKLTITLRFMATGETFRTLSFSAPFSNSFSEVIEEVLSEIMVMPMIIDEGGYCSSI